MSQIRSHPRGLGREQILAVATAHFARFGFRKTSLSEIAGELGVVKGALYYHFPGGKAELFDAAVGQVEAEMLQEMRAAADTEEDPRRALRALFACKIAGIRRQVTAHGVNPAVARELAAVPRDEQAFQAAERKLIEGLLQRGEKSGAFRRVKPRAAAARAIQAMLREPVLSAALDPAAATSRNGLPLQAVYFDILIDGLAADAPAGETE